VSIKEAQIFVVTEKDHDQRIDKFLSQALVETSRSLVQKQIQKHCVLINDQPLIRGAKTHIKFGDQISYVAPKAEILDIVGQDIPIDILFQDDDIVVVNKPSNLVVHPAIGHPDSTLVNALIHHVKDFEVPTEETRPGIVHRLDRDTTGVMVVAKHRQIQRKLVELFQERKVHKQYLAVVRGIPKDLESTFETQYGRHPRDRKRFSSRVMNGKLAITHYRISEIFLGCCLAQVNIETGRTHQIRVHFQDHGHPLVGDPVYGSKRGSKDPRLDPILTAFSRPALHAMQLSFVHPGTEQKMKFEAPIPEDLSHLIEGLRRVTPESV
jgi:23S rRNA pseudouridine1911/1915/1917 synthase